MTPASPAPPSSEDDGGLDRTRTKMGIAATVALVLLFAVGAMIGNAGNVGKPAASTLSPVQQTLAGLGLGAGRFTCSISSDPSGARVAIDGKVLDMTTPVQVELPPGAHKVTLSLPRYGGRTVDVTGRRDQHVPVEVTLWGSIQVRLPRHESAAVHVLVDGEDHGIAPIFIDHVTPGPHEVEFAASAQERWGRTFEVRIGAVTEVTAHTFDLPATGILEIDAAYEDEGGSAPVGARVWVDGRLRGRTPLKLNLARGPHSVRGEYDGEQSAVQVIDLPGGNRRFASIRFESDGDTPRLATKFAKGPTRGVMAVTATLRGVRALDLASMWLHVRFADGVWRRLPMAISTVAAGTIGITELQSSDLPRGAPVYYVSALRNTGEEYFTEIGASAPQSAPMALTP